MRGSDQFRQLLENGDYRFLRKIWSEFFPHLPQPESDFESEVTMHIARTGANSVSLKKRAYSHRWLTERSLTSNLPEDLKPEAERLYPKKVEAVGISCNTSKEWLKPAIDIVRKSMEDTVNDCFANGDTDPTLVKSRILRARDSTLKKLIG